MEKFITALKGLAIGGTMLVPGVSGGSMAMILGIYDKLIASIGDFRKKPKNNIIFLGFFVLGALIGIVLFAKPLGSLIERFPKPMMFFFMGAVAGGLPMIYKESGVKKFTWRQPVFIGVGLLIVILLSFIPRDIFNADNLKGIGGVIVLIVAGIVLAVALVLPGISVSYMLLIMGLYEQTLDAISNVNLAFIAPLAGGVFLGILLTTKLLSLLMEKFPDKIYLIILGFVGGSLIEAFPGIPLGVEWLLCIPLAALGFYVIWLLGKKS